MRGILSRGGTIIGTSNRGNPFSSLVETHGKVELTDISDQVIENFHNLGADVLIAVGGEDAILIPEISFSVPDSLSGTQGSC